MRPIGALLLTLGLVAAVACSQAVTPVSPTPSPTPQPTASPTPTEAGSTPTGEPSPTPIQEGLKCRRTTRIYLREYLEVLLT